MIEQKTDVLLTVDKLSMSIGTKNILKNHSYGIHSGERIGLIGINGCGKTTLLKLLALEIEPSEGNITLRNEVLVAYLPQNPVFEPQNSVMEHVLGSRSVPETELYKFKAILTKLGMNLFDKPMQYLSGGQKRKADLARVLSLNADILLLDEPTNHLDLESIEWLQDYLVQSGKCIIFVTHDRYFLDAVANKIIEIEAGSAFFYPGSYSDYVKGKIQRDIDAQRKETRRKAQLSKELAWLSRGAQARTSKPKNHIDRVKELIGKSYLISNAELEISFQTDRLGKTILELHRLSKAYEDRVLFENIEHNFQAKERIGIIGPNGCGKTTLLKLITEEESPDAGSIKTGVNTHFSYYKQEDDTFDPRLSVYDYIAQYAEVIKTKDGTKFTATEMLNRFLFDGKMQQSKLGSLSGGERKRLYLLKSLMFGANFIILDEPTNDLDIRTLEILEDYLDAFEGCLLVVSHDRFFLDRTVDYLFIFEGKNIRKFPGSYSDYLLVKRYEAEEESAPKIDTRPKRVKKGLSYNEKMELEKLEKCIEELEKQKHSQESMMNNPSQALSYDEYDSLSKAYHQVMLELDNAIERWAELSSKIE